jgi:putative ABC transport system permease protein
MLIVPRERFYAAFPFQQRSVVFVRTSVADAGRVGTTIAGAVQRLDRDMPVYGLRTAAQHMARFFADQRLLGATFATLAAIALGLSGAGLFAVVASSTEARRRELAIRIALGIRRGKIRGMVLAQTALLVGAGIAIGAVLSLGLGRVLASFLFRVAPYDPVVIAVAAVVLSAVALAATYGPVRRALAIEPSQVMRME